MSCNPNVREVVSPKFPDPKGFSVARAVRVTAFGLSGSDHVTFKRVDYCSKLPDYGRDGCCLFTPEPAQIASAVEYQIGECQPNLNAKRNTIIIPYAGSYLPVINGSESADLTIQVEAIEGVQFDDKEKGINPCGLPCVINSWTWTGGERVNGERVEREYRSNCDTTEWRDERALEWVETGKTRCVNHVEEAQEQSEFGKLRWTATGKTCGYSPSVPISDGCEVGYMFHPDEERDPAASVAVSDCDGRVLGYIYPTAATGRTVEVGHCAGVIVGYAVNRSETAFDVKCKEC